MSLNDAPFVVQVYFVFFNMIQAERKKKVVGNKKKKTKATDKRLPQKPKVKKKRSHPAFGTSKAEQDFAKDFLDKLGVRYEWQYEAREIGRFYDYYLPDYRILLEYDGEYYHPDKNLYGNDELNPMQKHNRRVDEVKDRWALLHGIPLIRIREKDVREHPEKVMKMLRERLKIQSDVLEKEKNMAKRHINRLNEGKK